MHEICALEIKRMATTWRPHPNLERLFPSSLCGHEGVTAASSELGRAHSVLLV